MKKFIYTAFIALFLVNTSTNVLAADSKAVKTEMTQEQIDARISQIQSRVEEIKNIDRSALSPVEKKELRTELKAIKSEANAISNGGIYLSLTAILIIIIILILI